MTFEFSERASKRVEWLRTRYPTTRALILPVLHMAQRENNGWVSPEVIRYVAELLPVPPIWVKEVATFYTMYNLKPIGRHHLQVCTNLCCALNGGETVHKHISKKLGIGDGQTTPDGKFTLTKVECLGACGYAPMMQVNDTFHENLTLSKVNTLLDEMAAESDTDLDEDWAFVGPGTGGTKIHPESLRNDEDLERVRSREQVILPEHHHHDDHGKESHA